MDMKQNEQNTSIASQCKGAVERLQTQFKGELTDLLYDGDCARDNVLETTSVALAISSAVTIGAISAYKGYLREPFVASDMTTYMQAIALGGASLGSTFLHHAKSRNSADAGEKIVGSVFAATALGFYALGAYFVASLARSFIDRM